MITLTDFYISKTLEEYKLIKMAGFFKSLNQGEGFCFCYLNNPLVQISLQTSNKNAKLSLLRNAHLRCFYTFDPNTYKLSDIYKKTWRIYKDLYKEFKVLKKAYNTPTLCYWFYTGEELADYLKNISDYHSIMLKFIGDESYYRVDSTFYKYCADTDKLYLSSSIKNVNEIKIDYTGRKIKLYLSIDFSNFTDDGEMVY